MVNSEKGEYMVELLTIPGFCQRYGVSRSTAYRLLSTGELKAVKVGRLTRIRDEDAARWVANLAAYGSSAA
jgi:excisionase family DNA binding protein